MSYLLEILGRGLDREMSDVLDRYYWSPQTRSLEDLQAEAGLHDDSAELQFHCGVASLHAAKFDDAVEYLERACAVKSNWHVARLALAAAHESVGHPAEALAQLATVNDAKPGQSPILLAMGFCCERLNDAPHAMEMYRGAIEIDPTAIQARQRLAAAAVAQGEFTEAVEQYKYLREFYPEAGWVLSSLGHLYYKMKDPGAAIDAFEMALAMDPENWSLMDDEVEILLEEGRYHEAIVRLKQLIEQQPGFPDLLVRLGDVYANIGEDDQAMACYAGAVEMQPDYVEAVIKSGTQHLVHGRWHQAAEAFGDACDLNDRVMANYVGRGVAQLASGNRQAAMESFDLAGSIEPNSTLLLSEMARLTLKAVIAEEHYGGMDHEPASDMAEMELDNDDLLAQQIDAHAEQVALHPDYADLQYRYGVLLRSQGQLGDAQEHFQRAIEINPGYVQALIKLGITHQELGHEEEAIVAFRSVLEIEPHYVDVHYRLGLLHTNRRQFLEAVEHMEHAANGQPDNPDIRAGLALSLQNMGLMDRSVATWRSLWRMNKTSRS